MITRLRTATAFTLLTISTLAPAQQPNLPPQPTSPPTPRVVDPSTQMLDLFAANGRSGVPDLSLTENDLELLDDGKSVPIARLLQPGQPGIRPMVLWIVVQCVMPGEKNDGSGFLRGFTADLSSGLTRLGPGEAFGVAHWCDDGAMSIDLPPNRRIVQLGPMLTQVLSTTVNPPNDPFLGESALIKVIRETIAATARFNSEAMPVLLFLYGDHSAASASEVHQLAQLMLSVPANVFVVNNGIASMPSAGLGETRMVLAHLAGETGGSYFHPPFGSHDPLMFAQAIATVVDRLHTRYQIAWIPRRHDKQEYPVSVRLTSSARKAHANVELRSRLAYIASPGSTP